MSTRLSNAAQAYHAAVAAGDIKPGEAPPDAAAPVPEKAAKPAKKKAKAKRK
jgi:hypothetical protein